MSRAGVRKVDHVALVVPSIADAVPLFVDMLGGVFTSGGDNHDTGNRIVHLKLAGFKLELMQPLRPDSLLQKHLDSRGPGFHHVTFLVDDLPKTITELEAGGFEMTGTDLSMPEWRESFMRRRSGFGALFQFADTTLDWDVPQEGFTLDDVLAGRVHWQSLLPCLVETEQGA